MKIHPIQTGTVRIKTNQRQGKGRGLIRQLNMFLDSNWTEPLPIYAWVIEHPEGIIVVDTGDTAKTMEPGYFPRWHPYYKFGAKMDLKPKQEIGPQLQKLGYQTSDIKKLIFILIMPEDCIIFLIVKFLLMRKNTKKPVASWGD